MDSPNTDDSWLRLIIIVIAVVVLLPLLVMGLGMPMMGMMGWWMHGGFGPGVGISPLWGLGMMLVWLVILVAIGYVVYRVLTHGSIGTGDQALEELRLAYARGDLSDEEFERRRERLEHSK